MHLYNIIYYCTWKKLLHNGKLNYLIEFEFLQWTSNFLPFCVMHVVSLGWLWSVWIDWVIVWHSRWILPVEAPVVPLLQSTSRIGRVWPNFDFKFNVVGSGKGMNFGHFVRSFHIFSNASPRSIRYHSRLDCDVCFSLSGTICCFAPLLLLVSLLWTLLGTSSCRRPSWLIQSRLCLTCSFSPPKRCNVFEVPLLPPRRHLPWQRRGRGRP